MCVCHLVRSAEIKKRTRSASVCARPVYRFIRAWNSSARRCCGCGGVVDGTVRRRSDTAAAVISWRFQRLRVILAPAQHHSSAASIVLSAYGSLPAEIVSPRTCIQVGSRHRLSRVLLSSSSITVGGSRQKNYETSDPSNIRSPFPQQQIMCFPRQDVEITGCKNQLVGDRVNLWNGA